jgi:hypothetical protein
MGWTTRGPFLSGQVMFSLSPVGTVSCLGQPPVHWVSKCEADHSPQTSSEVKNVWSFIFSPSVHLHGLLPSTRTTFILPFHFPVWELLCSDTVTAYLEMSLLLSVLIYDVNIKGGCESSSEPIQFTRYSDSVTDCRPGNWLRFPAEAR